MRKIFLMTAMGAALCIVGASCSDDDDNKGVVAPSEVTDFGGHRLMSFGDYYGDCEFSYNSDGTLRQITNEGDKIVFDYENGIITKDADSYKEIAHFKTNKKGFISEFTISGVEYEDGTKSDCLKEFKFEYNGNDHISKIAYHYQDVDIDSGVRNEAVTWNFSWNGDLLSTIKIQGESTLGGHETWNNTQTYFYADAPENRFMQYTWNVVEAIDMDSDFTIPIYVGMFGKGPSKYPTRIKTDRTSISASDGSESDSYENDISYILNSNGLVEFENPKGYSIKYTYSGSSKANTAASSQKSKVRERRHSNGRNRVNHLMGVR